MSYTITYRDGKGKIHLKNYSDISTAAVAIIEGFRSGAEWVNIEEGQSFGDDIASM